MLQLQEVTVPENFLILQSSYDKFMNLKKKKKKKYNKCSVLYLELSLFLLDIACDECKSSTVCPEEYENVCLIHEKRLLPTCIHHFKSDLIYSMFGYWTLIGDSKQKKKKKKELACLSKTLALHLEVCFMYKHKWAECRSYKKDVCQVQKMSVRYNNVSLTRENVCQWRENVCHWRKNVCPLQ